MKKNPLLGLWKYLVRIPSPIWQREVSHNERDGQSRLSFFSPDHHKVRDYCVLELPRRGRPLSLEEIARDTHLSLERTPEVIVELEKGMTFLFRNATGEVAWAYPVTADPTPHRIRFNTGEQIYAA